MTVKSLLLGLTICVFNLLPSLSQLVEPMLGSNSRDGTIFECDFDVIVRCVDHKALRVEVVAPPT